MITSKTRAARGVLAFTAIVWSALFCWGCGSDTDAEPAATADTATDAAPTDDTGIVTLAPRFADPAEIIFIDVTDEHGHTPSGYQSGHPIQLTVQVRPTKAFDGDIAALELQLGLVQKHADGADHADVHTCYLGAATHDHATISKNADGTYTFVMTQLIPDSCTSGLDTGATRIFNVWAGINVPQEHDARGDHVRVANGDDNTLFFNSEQVDSDGLGRNKLCKDRNGKPGCVYDIVIGPSQGPNVAVTGFELESTILPLDLASCGTATHHADPGLSFALGITLYGRDPHDGTSREHPSGNHLDEWLKAGESIAITAEICPVSDKDGVCADGTAFERLHVTPRQQDKTTIALADHVAITSMRAGHEHLFGLDAHVDAMTPLCERLTNAAATGSWAGFSHFRLKVCATPPFPEKGHGAAIDADHCRVDIVRVVLIDHGAVGAASSLSFGKSWKRSFGNSTFGAVADFGSDNGLNLSGARSHTWAKAKVTGWLSIAIAEVDLDAAAQVSVVGSYLDGHVDLLGKRVYGYSKSIPEASFSYEKSWAKSACVTYNYGIAGVGLNASVCASGTAGAKFDASIKAVQGAGGKPFDSATTIGEALAGVTPFVAFDLSATAELNAGVTRGGMTGTLTLIDVSLPTGGNLYWGLVAGPALVVKYGITSKLQIELLSGDVSVYVDLLKPKWCKCGKFCPKYPCAKWKSVVQKTLVSFSGWKYGMTLLSASQSSGLTLK